MFLIAKELTKYFTVEKNFFNPVKRKIKALDGISFWLVKGETLGIVGESGCGKTTLARILGSIILPTSGEIQFSKEITKPSRDIQMVFQNPYESLDPKMSIEESLLEPLIVNKIDTNPLGRVKKALESVHLPLEWLSRLPHQFSGGQRQKIVIARAIAPEPKLLICDEPTSSLDLSLQAQILNLLMDLKEKNNLTLIFISHNLKIIKIISDRIMVMHSGIIVEIGPRDDIVHAPAHPYTRLLMDITQGKKEHAQDPYVEEKRCKYFSRCRFRQKKCQECEPKITEISKDHWVACFNPLAC